MQSSFPMKSKTEINIRKFYPICSHLNKEENRENLSGTLTTSDQPQALNPQKSVGDIGGGGHF